MDLAVAGASPFALDAACRELLLERAGRARRSAERSGSATIAAATWPVDAGLDLSAAVLSASASTGDGSRFCLEQPDRDGFALAALGEAALIETAGPGRFAAAAVRVRALARSAQAGEQDPQAPDHAGPLFVGGFAFADAGGGAPEWSSLAPGRLVLPELLLARRGGEARATACLLLGPGDDPAEAVERLGRRLEAVVPASMPLLDPDPASRPRVAGAAPPSHYEEAVARAVERIRAGAIEKIVLAREVRVHAGAPIDPAPVFDALRGAFPACFSYLVGTRELAFLGASPELLVRREGQRAQTVALAGTTRRSADPAVDQHLGEQLLHGEKEREEQAIVTRRIERTLEPLSVWVAAAEEPVLVKVLNVQHLATPIRAQLREPLHCLEIAGRLHPTPAVGGEPRDAALELIPALEGLDRGWYAGPVGWVDLSGDGELCVAIRCALIRDRVAHLYSGNGIVAESDPADELAETEVKLEALLPLLA